MTSPGVFVRTDQSDEEIIKACQQLLHSRKSDDKIVAVKRDDIYKGVKVFFNGESAVLDFLKKKFLFDRDHPSIRWDRTTVHSLTTSLTAQNAFPTSRKEFEKVLQSGMEILGPVLEVSMIPISKEFPDIGNGKWRVVLDVPEVEDFNVFKSNGLPEGMPLKLPGLKEKLLIRFHCRFCEADGHSQSTCSMVSTVEGSNMACEEDPPCGNYSEDTSTSGFRIRDIQIESVASCTPTKPKSVLKPSVVREFEKEIGMEEACRYNSSREDAHKEKNELSGSEKSRSRISSGEPTVYDCEKKYKVKRARSTSTNESSCEDTQPGDFTKASSTTADRDTTGSVLPGVSKRDDSSSWFTPGGLFESRKSFSEDSAQVSTSNQPEMTNYVIKSEVHTTDDESDWHRHQLTPARPVRKRKMPVQGVPVVIPDRIKDIARQVGGVLDVNQLEAFCNHVKKKSTPADFATMYTQDVDGLKRQLDDISSQYYLTPKIGTKPEIQFMKWFRGMRERFYGTPVKRRRS